jgi:hypothetical protein
MNYLVSKVAKQELLISFETDSSSEVEKVLFISYWTALEDTLYFELLGKV